MRHLFGAQVVKRKDLEIRDINGFCGRLGSCLSSVEAPGMGRGILKVLPKCRHVPKDGCSRRTSTTACF